MRIVTASLLLALPAAAQKAQLQPIDMFRLDYFMQVEAEEPIGWLDGGRYLVFDAGRPGPAGPRRWSAVEARTGAREPLVDHAALLAALAEAGVGEQALADLDDPERWTWSGDHERFVIDVAGDLWAGGRDGALVRLTHTPGLAEEIVQFAPGADRVSFVRENDLYVVPAGGGEAVPITTDGGPERFFGKLDWVYQEEVFGRGDFRASWWSPDGRWLAFLELDESPVQEFTLVSDSPARPDVEVAHYPKAGEPNPNVWLCVAPAAGGEVRRFDVSAYPDEDRLIVRVTWTPDSEEVFFQVQDRQQTWLDMLAGDVASGDVRKVFREGSDCWIEPGPEPLWLADGQEFLWRSERSGFAHLYRYGRDGSELGPLTEGEWQVKEVVAVDEGRGAVWFLSDRASPLQTHLFRVALADREIVQVTEGRGTWEVEVAPGRELFLGTWSTVERPPSRIVCDAEGERVRTVAEPQTQLLAQFGLQEPEFVRIETRDGFPMEAMLILPADHADGTRLPVVQHTYSGPHTPRVRDEWHGRDYLWHQLLVQRGYLVFVCDNRSASGKGRRYAKACWRDLGTSEMRDLEDGVAWLVAKGLADPARVGMWGWSYGAYQTLFNMTHSKVWKCGIAVNAVTDWRNYDTIYTERYLGLPTANQQGYDRSSAVLAAANLHGGLMLVAAAMDDNVHMQNSLQFLHALQMAGKDCDFMVYPRVRHGIETLQQQLHLFGRMERFLREELSAATGAAGR